MASSRRIVTWNAKVLTQRKYELETFLSQEKIDIMLLSETHFTGLTVFRIRNYQTYSTEHPSNKARGGTEVLVRNSIQHYCLPKFQQDYLQASAIQVKTNKFSLTVAAAYCPHSCPDYSKFAIFLNTLGNKFVVGGDFNCKHTHWGSRLTTPSGRQLFQALNSTQTTSISTGKPTHWPTDSAKQPDLLYFFLAKGISTQQTLVEKIMDLSSDHIPILLTVATGPLFIPSQPNLVTKQTNWDYFREVLESLINVKTRLRTESDLEKAVEVYTSSIYNAAKIATPSSNLASQPRSTISYPLEIRQLVDDRRYATWQWQNNRNPTDKKRFNKLCKQLHKKIY